MYHVVNCIRLYYLLRYHVYKSYHSMFKSHMYFRVRIKTHAYAVQFLFLVINTHIVDLIQLVHIKIRFNIFILFLFSTYFIIFLQEDFINYTLNNSIIPLLTVKFLPDCRIVPAVLSRPAFSVLRTKVSQDPALV